MIARATYSSGLTAKFADSGGRQTTVPLIADLPGQTVHGFAWEHPSFRGLLPVFLPRYAKPCRQGGPFHFET
jgi:hypothetical protein